MPMHCFITAYFIFQSTSLETEHSSSVFFDQYKRFVMGTIRATRCDNTVLMFLMVMSVFSSDRPNVKVTTHVHSWFLHQPETLKKWKSISSQEILSRQDQSRNFTQNTEKIKDLYTTYWKTREFKAIFILIFFQCFKF